MDSREVVILGAGPAGIAAAIQLTRSGLVPLLLEKDEVGGLLLNANLVGNYPGFPKGISGRDLAALFKEQLQRVGGGVEFEEAVKLDYKDDLFVIQTDRRMIEAKIVVIATGTRAKEIPRLEISDDVRNRVFSEIYPIMYVKGKTILIIGSGDAAFDYALTLSKHNKIIILNRSDRTRCLPILMDGCFKSGNISYQIHTEVSRIKKGGSALEVTTVHIPDGEEHTMHAHYLITAIGREPSTGFFSAEIEKNCAILRKSRRLFIIGDADNGIYRQTAISVGDGIRAAMEINGIIRGD